MKGGVILLSGGDGFIYSTYPRVKQAFFNWYIEAQIAKIFLTNTLNF